MGAYDLVYDSSGSRKPIEVVLTQYSLVVLNPATLSYTFDGARNTSTYTPVSIE